MCLHTLMRMKPLQLFVGITSCIASILASFASDLAGPDHRASAISFITAGSLSGQIFARVIGGVMGKFGTIPQLFWMASGAQVSFTLFWAESC